MIGLEEFVYTFVCGAMLMMSAIGLESAMVTPSLSRWEKNFFTSFFSVLVLASLAFFLELAAYLYPELAVLQATAYFIQTLFSAIAFPMLAIYLLHCCGENWRRSALAYAVLILWSIFVILLVIAQFTDFIWYSDADGQMQIGPAYNLLIGCLLVMQLIVLVGVIRRREKMSKQRFCAFLLFLVPVTIAVIVHILIAPVFTLIDITLIICVYAAYRVIVSDSVEQNLRQQREIERQRASIAVLQMRPHFIYNTMTSIYYLCDQDPGLAKQVTMDFTTYLRKNLAAIASEESIAFSEELEHARAYLAVEKAQFEDDLLVNFDTPHTSFRVPPLTLQPIVENAVKHGMDPDSGPLILWVRTRETGSGSEIIVEDNGPGFDSAVADKPHTTLANIRRRLGIMCDGRLEIAPRKEGGTVVKVTIPRQAIDTTSLGDDGHGQQS